LTEARQPLGGAVRYLEAEQLARDDDALDLVRALVDLHDLGVAHVALDRELPRVAVADEDVRT
jgi:hypothetical protein